MYPQVYIYVANSKSTITKISVLDLSPPNYFNLERMVSCQLIYLVLISDTRNFSGTIPYRWYNAPENNNLNSVSYILWNGRCKYLIV